MPGKKTIPLLLAMLLALAIVGCGGGGDETETTAAATTEEPQQLTQAELIERGDDICAEVNAAIGALNSEPEEAAVPETIEKTANLYLGMLEGIEELGTPEGDNGAYAEFMEATEALAKIEGEVKLAVEREDTVALGEAATESAPALGEFQTQAEAYGFEECSEDPGAPIPSAGAGGAEGGEEPEGVEEEEGGVEAEPEYAEPEEEAVAPEEEVAPETGGAGGGAEAAPEAGGGGEAGGTSGGVGPG